MQSSKENILMFIEEHKNSIERLKGCIKQLEQEYVDTCLFKVGDKVKITTDPRDGRDSEFIAYIGIIAVPNPYFNLWFYGRRLHGYQFKFIKPKKDGTMGNAQLWVHDELLNIEKL